jgi:hypothetical protein
MVMSTEILRRRFSRIGARLEVEEGPWLGSPQIDVRRDRRGEYFDIRFAAGDHQVGLEVVDAQRDERHLLLLVRDGVEKSKFLCGHDERHWFVAAIPEDARGVSGVDAAKVALQPHAVRALVERTRPKNAFRRRNSAYVRQGEWFFVAAARLDPPECFVLRAEPLTRGRGTPHVMEFAYRRGGDTVYVNRRHPTGISEARYARLTPEQRVSGRWQPMVRDPEVYAMGAVRHPDHATIQLTGWHRVLMNTEQGARAMRHVAFLD